MVKIGPDDVELDDGEQMLNTSEEAHAGWEQTLEDVRAMAADREASGYETLILTAGDTAPTPPEASEEDRWGLTYIVPSNQGEEFVELAERAAFDDTIVYQASSGGHAFVATECLDTERQLVVYIVGTYQLRHAASLVETALDRDKMYTHITKLDGTLLGTIEHDDAEQFFPDPDRFTSYGMDV